jgi:hypothetical protein
MELIVSATNASSTLLRQSPSTSPAWSAGEVEFDVLRTFWVERCALTKRQLQVRTGISTEDIEGAVANLCASGRLQHLNTLVESYALPAMGLDLPIAGHAGGNSPLHNEGIAA